MDDIPKKLNIEVSSRCNLNCIMCIREVVKEETGDMTLETYKALLPVFPEIETVNLIGIGEPLMNENLIEMIRLGKAHLPPNGTLSLTTNATLINRHIAEQLVSSGIDDVVISIDGATAETFNAIRKGATLDEVLRGIQLLNEAKKKLESQTPRLGFEFVAMKRNVAELPQLVDLAAQHGISFIIVTNLLPHTEEMNQQILYDSDSDLAIELFNEAKAESQTFGWDLSLDDIEVEAYSNALFGIPPLKDKMRSTKPVWTSVPGFNEYMEKQFRLLEKIVTSAREQNVLLNLKSLVSRDGTSIAQVSQIFDQASAKAQELSIALDLPPLIPRTRRECGFIRDRIAFVSWDGFVRPCHNLYHSYTCYVNHREKSITSVSFGNVLQQDFKEIWNSREYRSFRRYVDRFDFAPCGDCPHADGCYSIVAPVFRKDCYDYALPCGDCPWARGILQCM
ncbi:MAG TPA: radical SAM protein [Dehalococcoidia bacterium]|nr:radical SAM protein [Dehalococcoidia bacterium]